MRRFRSPRVGLSLVFLAGLVLQGASVNSVRASNDVVKVWLTKADLSQKLSAQADLNFSSNNDSADATISVDESTTRQTIDGFGGSLTDSAASVIYPSSQRNAIMTALFDPVNGIGESFLRQPMGATDFVQAGSNPYYTYDDTANDTSLNQFSIAHDTAQITPLLRQALALNPNLKIMATPWSAPAWMKSNNSLTRGGSLLADDYPYYAQYFVKFIKAYQDNENIPISIISVQNEVLANQSFPSMLWSADQEVSFVKNNLAPALRNANLYPKILVYDHNWDNTDYPTAVLNGDTNGDVGGVAWHTYGGNAFAMTSVHNAFPGKDMYQTEAGVSCGGGRAINTFMASLENWSKSGVTWNVALNSQGGPSNGGDTSTCTAAVTVDSSGNFTLTHEYYEIGHFSKFVQPGAVVIGGISSGTIDGVSFKNSDGSKVVVVHNNDTSNNKTVRVNWNNQSFTYTLSPDGVATFKWPEGPSAVVAVNAGGSASGSFSADSGFSDGYVDPGSGQTIDTGVISQPATQQVYQSNRYGASIYTLGGLSSNGSYRVRLHFCENYWNNAGQRKFNVAINGVSVLSDFDIIATIGGKNRALIKEFGNIGANFGGQITLSFSLGSADLPLISGIEVLGI